jgi:hypothetical protein
MPPFRVLNMVVCPLSRGWLGRMAGMGAILVEQLQLVKQLMKQLMKELGHKVVGVVEEGDF